MFSNRLKNISRFFVLLGIAVFVISLITTPNNVSELKQSIERGGIHKQAHELDKHDPKRVSHDLDHMLHQVQNRPWAALYVNAIYFLIITLGVSFFLAVQHAAQAGWSVVLHRVMEAVMVFLPYVAFCLLLILLSSIFHFNHMFHWMVEGISDPNHTNYDEIIAGKSDYLNATFFIIRILIYFFSWVWLAKMLRKYAILQDYHGGDGLWGYYRKNVKNAAIFLVVFAVTSSTASWDLIMSLDAHWFSTLFGWYVLAGMIVTGVTVIALITIYLKSLGHLENVNGSHIHDLGKFMFGFSIFWTYLWFSQFMLIWYSDIPEEVTYYMARFEEYKTPFLSMLVLNFICPILILMNSDFKRIPWFIVFTGILILVGHWLDVFVMIMPSTVGSFWYIGFVEVFTFLGFLGAFILVVMRYLSKLTSLQPTSNPLLEESKKFHL